MAYSRLRALVGIVTLLLFAVPQAGLATGEQIEWQVIGSGGGNSASDSYRMSATAGQSAVGFASSDTYLIHAGYWQDFLAPPGCCTLRGDVNNSTHLQVSDLTYLVDYLFRGGPAPSCEEHGDVDDSGITNVSDLTYLVDYLFRGGPPPLPC